VSPIQVILPNLYPLIVRLHLLKIKIIQLQNESLKDEHIVDLPLSKTLENNYHIFQTFNNCGPAALSMLLSYYEINISQKEIGDSLRPYQNNNGDNDDKSVTLDELGIKAKESGLNYYRRPAGNPEIIKSLIASDIPVITRTWLSEDEDIGHFRIIKGYDETQEEFIQDDSYDGKNLRYSYIGF
jgi:uncharacterized protein